MDSKTLARFWSKVDKNGPTPAHCPELGPCWVWTAASMPGGYGAFRIVPSRLVRAHRVSWEIAYARPVPAGLLVLHSCDNPPCVNPAHLFIGSYKDNMQDAARKGRLNFPPHVRARGDRSGARLHPERLARGEAHGNAKLTESLVRRIRTAVGEQRQIAKKFGVCQATVSQIRRRVRWAHVK